MFLAIVVPIMKTNKKTGYHLLSAIFRNSSDNRTIGINTAAYMFWENPSLMFRCKNA